MNKKYLTPILFAAAGLLAAFQLMKFDNTIAHTSSWTDGQAASWTIFSPLVDALILVFILLLLLSGTYLGLKKIKHQWVRMALSLVVALAGWLVFYALQLAIQQHLSHFQGV
jgi:hypothetical protein